VNVVSIDGDATEVALDAVAAVDGEAVSLTVNVTS
jgi:hypothetical protein